MSTRRPNYASDLIFRVLIPEFALCLPIFRLKEIVDYSFSEEQIYILLAMQMLLLGTASLNNGPYC
jgi:hypothetical protein